MSSLRDRVNVRPFFTLGLCHALFAHRPGLIRWAWELSQLSHTGLAHHKQPFVCLCTHIHTHTHSCYLSVSLYVCSLPALCTHMHTHSCLSVCLPVYFSPTLCTHIQTHRVAACLSVCFSPALRSHIHIHTVAVVLYKSDMYTHVRLHIFLPSYYCEK